MNEVYLRSAQIVGRSHILLGKNSQDALVKGSVEVNGKRVVYGVICDGCSEGKDSEVGAKLAAAFIGRRIEILVKSGVPLYRIPSVLRTRTIGFLGNILASVSFDSSHSYVNFIKNYLLFTIIGFVYTDEETIVFALGDGVVVIDDEVTIRDEKNKPSYIGYHLVDRRYLSPEASVLPGKFDVVSFASSEFSRIAIASDGLAEEPLFVPELWGYTHEIGLQKKVNVWSDIHHKFRDDLSIITLEVVKGGDDASLSR